MPKDKLCIFAEGLFFSLLNYCIEVYGNVWGLQTYDEHNRQNTAFRKEDNMKLQVLVNKVLRSLTGLDRDAPSSLLSSKSGQLSVHQRTALFTLTSVHKALGTKQPAYSYSALKPSPTPGQPVRLQSKCSKVNFKLSISSGSYLYRGSRKETIQPTPGQFGQNQHASSIQERCKAMGQRQHFTSSFLIPHGLPVK